MTNPNRERAERVLRDYYGSNSRATLYVEFIKELDAAVAEERRCTHCGGPDDSDKDCMCGGTGLRIVQIRGLEECIKYWRDKHCKAVAEERARCAKIADDLLSKPEHLHWTTYIAQLIRQQPENPRGPAAPTPEGVGADTPASALTPPERRSGNVDVNLEYAGRATPSPVHKDDLPGAPASALTFRPEKIFEHKYLDPRCVESGCRSQLSCSLTPQRLREIAAFLMEACDEKLSKDHDRDVCLGHGWATDLRREADRIESNATTKTKENPQCR